MWNTVTAYLVRILTHKNAEEKAHFFFKQKQKPKNKNERKSNTVQICLKLSTFSYCVNSATHFRFTLITRQKFETAKFKFNHFNLNVAREQSGKGDNYLFFFQL